jgi:hypothetical protein
MVDGQSPKKAAHLHSARPIGPGLVLTATAQNQHPAGSGRGRQANDPILVQAKEIPNPLRRDASIPADRTTLILREKIESVPSKIVPLYYLINHHYRFF